jgi:tetratricopeptide (TPR) repeat protein
LLTGEQRSAHFGMISLPAVTCRCIVAWCLAEFGGFAEGHGVGEEAVRLAETVEQPYSIASALLGAGLLSRRQGDVHRAIPILERCLTLCQTANIPLFFSLSSAPLGVAYALAGRAAEALPLLDQTLEHVASVSRMAYDTLILTELSEALLLVGRVAEASALAGRLLELSHTHTGRGYQAHALRLLGEVARRREPLDVDPATSQYHQALTLAEGMGMRPLQAHCHLGLGTLYARISQRQLAHTELYAAIDLYRAMDMTFWLPEAEAALMQVNDARMREKGAG